MIPAAGAFILASAAWAQTPWVVPAEERARTNPLPVDNQAVAAGEKLAKVNCQPCHGKRFKGDGPAAAALNPKPADWTSPRVQDQTDGELFWKISNGRGAMPPWKAQLSDKERWALIRFIRSVATR